jgi:hypothetical protein
MICGFQEAQRKSEATSTFVVVFCDKKVSEYNDHMNGALAQIKTDKPVMKNHDVKVPIDHFESQMGHGSQIMDKSEGQSALQRVRRQFSKCGERSAVVSRVLM